MKLIRENDSDSVASSSDDEISLSPQEERDEVKEIEKVSPSDVGESRFVDV